MEKELNIHFPTVIVDIISSYVSLFKGVGYSFSSENILDGRIVNDRIYSSNYKNFYVHDLEGFLIFKIDLSDRGYIQILEDGKILKVGLKLEIFSEHDGSMLLTGTSHPERINMCEPTINYPLIKTKSKYCYRSISYDDCTEICKIDPFSGKRTIVDLDVIGTPFYIIEYKDIFYAITEKTIYSIEDDKVKEIPIFGKIATDVNITENGILYYVSSSGRYYHLVFVGGKKVKLSIDKKSNLDTEIMLMESRLFLKTINFTHHLHTIMSLDINNGKIVHSKSGDNIKLIGFLSGCFAYSYWYDKLYIDLIKFSNGEIVSTHYIENCSYMDRTADKLIFSNKTEIKVLS